MGGNDAPATKAMMRLTVPATKPLAAAICIGSPEETLRVRLLSMAHAKHAPVIRIGPQGMPTSGFPAHDKTTPPAMIAAIPKAMRRSKFSRQMNQAIVAVKTPSRLSSNDVDAAGVSRSAMED